jgi:hypothetical protein
VRPVFHHRDDTTIGHIVGCFLALRLEVDLQRRLDERGVDVAWPDLMRDLAEVQAVEPALDGQPTGSGPSCAAVRSRPSPPLACVPPCSSRRSGAPLIPRPPGRWRCSAKVPPAPCNYPES